jgi:hypothetical protein
VYVTQPQTIDTNHVHLSLQASATWGELKQDLAQGLPGASADQLEVLLAYKDQADEGEAAWHEQLQGIQSIFCMQ